MSENKENVRSFLHTQYKQGNNAALAARNINTIYGQDVVTSRTSQNWFKKFREGRTSIEHKKGVQSHPTVNYRVLEQRFRHNPNVSLRELAKDVCSHEAVSKNGDYLTD
jgi:hypothetical protein